MLFISIGNYAQTIQFERTVYSFLDLFGYLGGLYDFLLIVGFVFVNNFQEKIYQNLIASNMYQIKSTSGTDDFDADVNLSVMEETKSNFHTGNNILNTRSSSLRRSNRNSILPRMNNRQEQISRADSLTNDQQLNDK